LVARFNADLTPLLLRYKIDPEALKRPDAQISFRAVVRLLEATAQTL
jgi:hypothetical protein